MKKMLPALAFAAALPVAALGTPPRDGEPAIAPASVASDDKPRPGAGSTDKERARLAKSKNKQKRKKEAARPAKDRKQTPAG
jgi:hypothetical protein